MTNNTHTKWPVHGYAILSADDMIADENGDMPESLKNEADWIYFQSELDQCALVVLGRHGHETNPNHARRHRLVISSQGSGLSRVSGIETWWNPADMDFTTVLEELLPEGGRIGVPGGRRVFDFFLEWGYTTFHLARAPKVRIPHGVPVFSGVKTSDSADQLLASRGLSPGPRQVLDPDAPVYLTHWSASGPSGPQNGDTKLKTESAL